MLKWLLRFLSVAVLVGLTACANTMFYARQQVFQQWPSDAWGKSYAMEPINEQALEKQVYAQMLSQQMERTGLVQATDPKKADFIVRFDYGAQQRTERIREYMPDYDPFFFYNPFFFNPWLGWRFGAFYTGFNFMYGARYRTREVDYNQYTLHVAIQERLSKKDVFHGQVVGESTRYSLGQVMPSLISAVFNNFPGNNGQVQELEFDLKPKK